MIEIPLSKKGKHAGKYVAIVSVEDADLAELNWTININRPNLFYVIRRVYSERRVYKLHRVIMERVIGRPLKVEEMVDHIDMQGLNCRRDNLRLATHSQNAANNKKRLSSKSSEYKGVYKSGKKWMSQIRVNGKNIYLGTFITEEEAFAAYREAADKYFGEFANYGVSNE